MITTEQANDIKIDKGNHLSLKYIIDWCEAWDNVRLEVTEKLNERKQREKNESTSNTCNK
jgi:hypothetical protein|nr:MAG TPA: hypothetical protein [Caudoviricetes sp.]